MRVIKRNGKTASFNPKKIRNAIQKAGFVDNDSLDRIVDVVTSEAEKRNGKISIEEIQDIVELELMKTGNEKVAREYIRYRKMREMIRENELTNESILRLIDDKNEYLKTENSNKNHTIASTQRDYIAGEVSKDLSMRLLLPKEVVEAHKKGAIHFHDADYFIEHIHNCALIDLEDILQNGTVINGTMIEKPHSFSTACNIATQVSAIIASNQYGGQTMSFTHLAPFVDVSRQRFRKELREEFPDLEQTNKEQFDKVVESRVRDEVRRGVQTIQYQILTLNSSNGQTPFITLFMYLNEAKDQQTKDDLALIIEEVLEQRYRGVKNEVGVWITPAFPKLIYTIEEDNCREGTKYWYLTKLAAKCSAKRLVPDYISEKKMIEFKGACFPCMGCRSFLPAWKDTHVVIKPNEQFELDGEVINSNILWDRLIERGEKVEDNVIVPSYDIIINHTIVNNKIKPCHITKLVRDKNGKVKINLESEFVFYGRWNQGVCTINLPYAALEAIRNVDSNCRDGVENRKALCLKEFWKVFDHYSELVHEALQARHARLLNTNVEISPLHWMYGGLARLPKNGTINDLLFDSFSSISYGYAGLYECVYALTGHSHTDSEGKKLALEILQKLNDYCDKWKKRENIGYSVYGSPRLLMGHKRVIFFANSSKRANVIS